MCKRCLENGVKPQIKSAFPLPSIRELAEEIEALRSEIELLKKLDHPRVVRYIGCLLSNVSVTADAIKNNSANSAEADTPNPNLDATFAGPDLLIFLEYMPCGSMASVLKKFGPYQLNLARKYTKQVLEGY